MKTYIVRGLKWDVNTERFCNLIGSDNSVTVVGVSRASVYTGHDQGQ